MSKHVPKTEMMRETINPPPIPMSPAIQPPSTDPTIPTRQLIQKPCLLFIKIPASQPTSAPIRISKIIAKIILYLQNDNSLYHTKIIRQIYFNKLSVTFLNLSSKVAFIKGRARIT